VTHDEAIALLPAYALGALESDTTALEAHLKSCASCSRILGEFLDTTAALGDAVETIAPPVALRDAILGHALPRTRFPRLLDLTRRLPQRVALVAASLLVVAGTGFGAGTFVQQRQVEATRATLAVDERGLALLTSTETTVDRLSPVAPTGTNEHGHWYHRPGIDTEVVVVEFMARPTADAGYYGWLQRRDGGWISVGRFTLDSAGYGRNIVLGSDGTEARGVTVTLQNGESNAPTGTVVLRGP
jgi:hypothetical protein